MRRAPAILLLLVFSFSLIPPAVFADSESKLPACCRRDGKHHCSMTSVTDGPSRASSLALKGTPTKCPLFPTGKAIPAAGKASVPLPTYVSLAPVLSHPTAVVQTEARYRVSFSRAWQERGPPSPVS